MKLAPFFSLLFTFWIYDNKQMFGNFIDPIKAKTDLRLSHHTFSTVHFDLLNWDE